MIFRKADPSPSATTGKLIFQIVTGGLAGFLAMIAVMRSLDGASSVPIAGDVVGGIAVATVYGLMGLLVGFGVLLPKLGAKLLNVADEEELHDGRRQLLGGAAGMLSVSLLLGSLALATGPNRFLDQSVASMLVAAALAGVVTVSLITRKQTDELMHRVSLESATLAFWLTILTFGGWAALAVLGHAPMFSAMTLIAGLFALFLLAMFIVIARRGMMTTRRFDEGRGRLDRSSRPSSSFS